MLTTHPDIINGTWISCEHKMIYIKIEIQKCTLRGHILMFSRARKFKNTRSKVFLLARDLRPPLLFSAFFLKMPLFQAGVGT